MLDLKRKMFFIHIPKTGGSSIEIAHGFRYKIDGPEDAPVLLRHRTYPEMQKYLRKENIDTIPYVFCTVRNIFERLRSTYRHHFRAKDTFSSLSHKDYTFDDYIETIRRFFFGEMVTLAKERIFLDEKDCGPLANHRHVQPMEWWLGDAAESCIFLSFENLEKDYSNKIGPLSNCPRLPRFNTTPAEYMGIPAEYSEDSIEVVSEIYSWEIQKFGMKAP